MGLGLAEQPLAQTRWQSRPGFIVAASTTIRTEVNTTGGPLGPGFWWHRRWGLGYRCSHPQTDLDDAPLQISYAYFPLFCCYVLSFYFSFLHHHHVQK